MSDRQPVVAGRRPRQVLVVALVLLALAAFAAQQLSLGAARRQPRYDEIHYLSVARDYARMGGVAAAVRCHLEGRCPEDNRYPVYEFVLQAFAHDGPGFYADAKLVTLGTALLLFAVVGLVAWRAFSPATALATVVLLALMPSLGEIASGVLADVLFAAVLFACVHGIGASLGRGPLAWLGAGALVGLCYLTKGNGHLALLGLVSAGLVLRGPRLLRAPQPYAALLGFAAVAFFLLWRNAVVYGNPLHNFNDRPLWLDSWEQTWRMLREPEWDRVGLRWYLAHHSVFALGSRLGRGVGQVIGVLLYTAGLGVTSATPIHLQPTVTAVVVRVVTGLGVMALAVRGLLMRLRDGRRAEVLAVTHVTFWLLLAFAVGGQGVGGVATRFMLPVAVLLVPYAAWALLAEVVPRAGRAVTARLPWVRPWRPLAALILLAPLAVKLGWFGGALRANPRQAFTVPARWGETSAWLSTHLRPGERYAFPHTSLYSTWDRPLPDPDARWIYLFTVPPGAMMRAFDEAKPLSLEPRWDGPPLPITKALIDTEAKGVDGYRDKLSATRDEHGPLAFLGWPRCFADGGRPSRFLIYCR